MIQVKYQKNILILWLLTMAAIPILSIIGRPLQRIIFAYMGAEKLAVLLSVLLFLCLLCCGYYLFKSGGKKQLFQFFWSIPLLVLILLATQSAVELSHVILFGLFGFLSLRLFPVLLGVIIGVLVSGSDELLQLFLADRVGDWQDVLLNLMSTGLGGLWAYLSRKPD